MTQYKFDVTMTYEGCSGAVTRVLKKFQGVDNFEVSLEKQSAVVESASLTQEKILEVVQKTVKPAKMTIIQIAGII